MAERQTFLYRNLILKDLSIVTSLVFTMFIRLISVGSRWLIYFGKSSIPGQVFEMIIIGSSFLFLTH